MRINGRKVLSDSENPAHYIPESVAVAGLVNGRLLRQRPTHLEDHPLKGKYLIGADGDLLLESGRYAPGEMDQGFDVSIIGSARHRLFRESTSSPLQGMLFMPPDEQRHGPSTDYRVYRASAGGPVEDSEASDKVHRNLLGSDMPSGLIKALRGQVNIDSPQGGYAGLYTPQSGLVTVSQQNGSGNRSVLIHELGHRADYRSHLAEGEVDAAPRVPAQTHPNPRLEGIADGFDDRYSSRRVGTGDFSHVTDTGGYTTRFIGQTTGGIRNRWSDSERAIYAAARAHFSETGENPTIEGKDGVVVKNNTDEYLHMMQRISPHARKALMENNDDTDTHGPLWNTAQQASRLYLSNRKIGTQLSLLPGMDRDLYDDPYANGVSAEQHAKTVEDELAAQKQRRRDINGIIEE
jgi:hypothetical protein